MSMSRAYERHSNAYDRRFKNYYAKGYKAGWNNYRWNVMWYGGSIILVVIHT